MRHSSVRVLHCRCVEWCDGILRNQIDFLWMKQIEPEKGFNLSFNNCNRLRLLAQFVVRCNSDFIVECPSKGYV